MAAAVKLSERRAFLNFLAGSPVLACAGFSSRWIEDVLAEPLPQQEAIVIKSVKEALNVFDFDAAARAKLSLAHYTFITDGSFNNETLRANRIQLVDEDNRRCLLLSQSKAVSYQFCTVTDEHLYQLGTGQL